MTSTTGTRKWNFRYAMNLSFPSIEVPMFRHSAKSNDPLEMMRFAADLGFAGVEDNRLSLRSTEEQERIGRERERLGISFGVFGLNGESIFKPSLESADPEMRAGLLAHVREAGEIARRVGGRCIVTNSKRTTRMPKALQLAQAIENLKYLADEAERQGIVLVVESVVPQQQPDMLFSRYDESYMVVKAVNHPAVKLLYDTFHMQAVEGNLLESLDLYWPEIAAVQLSDNPHRQSPGFGEINFVRILQVLAAKGYEGVIGVEARPLQDGLAEEQEAIALLREIDTAAGKAVAKAASTAA